MAQDNTVHQHRLFINKKEIEAQSSGALSISGDGRINKLSITVNDIDLQHDSLFNQEVEFYLGESNQDALPIFRGFVKRFTPSEKNVRIEALDVRTLLAGQDGIKITSTDEKNYDGKTAGQLLYDLINDKINYDKTIIDINLLKDMDKPVSMTDFRGKNVDAYQTINSKIKSKIDDDDLENPLTYFIDVKEGPQHSSIVIVKDKAITDVPSYTYSYDNGLESIKHKEIHPPNTVYYNDGRVFEYTSRNSGQVVTTIQEQEDVAESRNLALKQLLLGEQEKKEIDISVSKGYDIGLGSIVFLDVDEDDVYGPHRVVGKNITFGTSIKCILKLNKKPIKLSDYVQRQQE